MNFKYRRSIAAGLCLGGLLAATLPVAVGGPADVALFTSAEARQLMLDARQGLPIIQSRRLKQRSMVMGPRIEMKAPPLRQDAQEQTVLETGADA